MTKRRLKKGVKLITLLFAIVVCCGLGYLLFSKDVPEVINQTVAPKEVWPKEYNMSLLATGDALLHGPLRNAFRDSKTNTYDFTDALMYVKDIISSYDVAYYNQESVSSKRYAYVGYPVFNSPQEFNDAMIAAGFDLVSLASNHSADMKENAINSIIDTYDYWSNTTAKFDGFNKDDKKINEHNIDTVNNIKYGFLNYTDTLNGLNGYVSKKEYYIDLLKFATYNGSSCPTNYVYSEIIGKCVSDNLEKEVTALRKEVDVLIVAMHWHYNSPEYSFTPTEFNINIAKYLNSLGVDIILGTYSHCLQPFDVIESNGHKTAVFYSLSNFISNQRDANSTYYKGVAKGQIGVLATMNIKKTLYEDGTFDIDVGDFGADLIYTYDNNHKDYRVVPFSMMDETFNKNYVDIYNTYSKILTNLNDNITIKPLKTIN